MSQPISAHFDGRVIVPDEPLNLPSGQRLRVEIEKVGNSSGRFSDLKQFATDLPDAPSDLASQHDHYLYEQPKH